MTTSTVKTFIAALMLMAGGAASLYAQEQPEPPDVIEMAEKEADRLQELLKLEDWQVFYVDSTLKHDFPAMQDELMKLQAAKVSNSSMYINVQDKWMETIDNSYRKILSDEQWDIYMKTSAGKALKAREKRKQKAAQALAKLKEKMNK